MYYYVLDYGCIIIIVISDILFTICISITKLQGQSCKKCRILGSGSGGKNENGEIFLGKNEGKNEEKKKKMRKIKKK